jgi:hypothetical protein
MRKPTAARRLGALAALLALGPTAATHARMYQWVDPGTGTVQLSGSPPGWYRAARQGPRVFVFEDGRLIDDTAQRVADEQAEALRAAAFGGPPTTQPATSPLGTPLFSPTPSPAAASPAAEDSTSARIAEFKALLENYDRTQGAAARDVLEDAARAALPPTDFNATAP